MAFFELSIGMSGLFAAQKGLQVTSNNITNATTKGYSRQELGQQASTPLGGLSVGMVGTGVSTTGITRIRDSYIDSKLWAQNAKLGEYNIKVTQNSLIESVYGEPSDSGFTAVFNNMFEAMSNLSKDPSSGEAKVALREEMISFTKYYNSISSTLQQYQKDLNYEFKATVQEINTLATRIQNLNKQIFESELYGNEASSFRDERDLCIDRLSEIINVEATEYEADINGHKVKYYKVEVAGQTLVDHDIMNTLEITVRGEEEKAVNNAVKELEKLYKDLRNAATADEVTAINNKIDEVEQKLKASTKNVNIDDDGNIIYTKNGNVTKVLTVDVNYNTTVEEAGDGKFNVEDADGLYDLVWSNGMSFDTSSVNLSGELKGIIDMRDGCGTGAHVTYNGIPYYIQRMDEYVRKFAQTMNETYSSNEQGHIEIDEVQITADITVKYIEKDESGAIVGYYDADGKSLPVLTEDQINNGERGLTNDQASAVQKTYTTKYKLFSYTTEGTGPTSGDDITGIDYSKITASNFSISEEIYSDVNNMRTVYDKDNPSDTNFMLDLLAQKDNKHMFKEGDPKDYMISIFSDLGINAKEAKMYQNTQVSVTSTIINQRLSVSQVDTSEEFTNLIKFQQAYQAAAKVINTIDGIYETTIFKLGNF